MVIGTNFISDKLCYAAKECPGIEIAAVYSRKSETGEAFAKKHGIKKLYDNLAYAWRGRNSPLGYPVSK